MRVHNPEYQPPVTSGSRVTGYMYKFCQLAKTSQFQFWPSHDLKFQSLPTTNSP